MDKEDRQQIRFQLLTPDDLDLMRDLLGLYGHVFEMADTYQAHQPDDSYLANLLKRDDFISLIAREGNQVIAGLSGYVLHKFEQNRREFYIYDLAVHENWRRRKIATGLINRLKEEARARDIYVIFVQADFGDLPAMALYRSLGLEEQALHYDIQP